MGSRVNCVLRFAIRCPCDVWCKHSMQVNSLLLLLYLLLPVIGVSVIVVVVVVIRVLVG